MWRQTIDNLEDIDRQEMCTKCLYACWTDREWGSGPEGLDKGEKEEIKKKGIEKIRRQSRKN